MLRGGYTKVHFMCDHTNPTPNVRTYWCTLIGVALSRWGAIGMRFEGSELEVVLISNRLPRDGGALRRQSSLRKLRACKAKARHSHQIRTEQRRKGVWRPLLAMSIRAPSFTLPKQGGSGVPDILHIQLMDTSGTAVATASGVSTAFTEWLRSSQTVIATSPFVGARHMAGC